MFTFTVITFILLITTMVNIGVTYIAWVRRKTQNNLYFVLGMIGVTCWTFASALDYASVRLSDKIFFAKLEAVGYHSAFTLFAVFSMYYAGTDHWLKKNWVRFLVFFIPISNIGLTVTNELHGWIWSGFIPQDLNVVIFEYGPAYSWVTISGYAQLIFIYVHMWIAFRKGTDFTKRQVRILMFALMFPIAFNLLYHLGTWGIRGVDWTSLTFSISSVLFLYALHGLKFLEIVPVAYNQLVASMEDGMIVMDTQNRIIDMNPASERMLRIQSAGLIGRDISELKPFASLIKTHLQEQVRRVEFECCIQPISYFEAVISPLLDERKKLFGHLILLRDITERKENELKLLKLNRVAEDSPASIVITDLDGNITYANPQFTKLTGYTLEEVIGRNPRLLSSGNTPTTSYKEMWQTILGGGMWRGEFLNRKKNGDLYWEDVVISAVKDSDGNIVSFLAVKMESTERKRIEKELQASEERFRQLVTSAPDAVFGIDQNGRITFANRQASLLLGYAENELIDRSIEILVPDHLRNLHKNHRSKYISNPFTRAMGNGLKLAARRKDGTEIPVEINLSHSTTQDGSLVIAFMRDITERRRIELEREPLINDLQKRNIESESLRETAVIVTSTTDFADAVQRILFQLKRVIAYDSASVWLYKGDAAHMIGGDGTPEMTAEEMRYTISEADPDYPLIADGAPYVLSDDIQINYPVFRQPPINYIRSWVAVPLKVRGKITGFIALDGRKVGQFTPADAQLALTYANQVSIALENVQLISDLKVELGNKENLITTLDKVNSNLANEIEDRKQTEMLLQGANQQLSQQVDEIRELQNNMRELAIRDPLTRLHNRHYLNEILGRELARATREGYVISFILVDIDHFKKINDTFGHATGDVVLRAVAKQFEAFSRSGDILVRYGGEEFLLALPNTPKPAAVQIADRLRTFLQNSHIEDNQIHLSITISCGVSEFPTDSNQETQVLSMADKALYDAKNGGRNQVVAWNSEASKESLA